ncbi:hypothetical protein B0H16DRAFT_298750 [Mycena metata]|uniref:Protein SQS1 n=1 Tax=Mycena metata TaxID=1033252 RepID=A0AAD7KFA6_9AGAR|nr:hypothetical protein B0H16DRAFT_298750 [Mycena metata]
MFRGSPNPNRGGRGGGDPRGKPHRGRTNRGRGRGRGRGGPAYDLSTDTDFIIQMYPDYSTNRGGYASPGARGRGIGSPSRGYDSPGGRGRGRGNFDSPQDNYRGRGRGRGGPNFDSPQDNYRGRGRGRGGPKLGPNAPLSKLLYEERPLLRPIKFVRSVHHATLFQEEEELIQPVVEDVGEEEQSHVPTADRVARVFSGNIPRLESENEGEETLEEIDFEDLGKLREEVDAAAASLAASQPLAVEVVEEQFMGFFINKPQPAALDSPMPEASVEDSLIDVVVSASVETSDNTTEFAIQQVTQDDADLVSASAEISAPSEPLPPTVTEVAAEADALLTSIVEPTVVNPPPTDLFYVDTTPTPIALAPGAVESALAPLRAYPEDDDEVIVYVAPHPRVRDASPSPSLVVPPSLSTTSILTGTSIVPAPAAPTSTPAKPDFASVSFTQVSPQKPRRLPPVFTVQGRAKAQTRARVLARRIERRAVSSSTFGAFGAQVAEARLRGSDPRRDEQRRGDSDVDWGDSEDEEQQDGGGDDSGMTVDVDLDAAAMARFARGMGAEGSRFVTMDDIRDEHRMREEDADLDGDGTSSEGDSDSGDEEVDAVVDAEEGLMIAEPADLQSDEMDSDDDDEDSDEDDNGQSPKTGFQARLERLRKAARERGQDDRLDFMDAEDSDDDYDELLQGTWADRDEDFASEIQAILDENGDILSAGSRQGRKKLLKAVANGEIVDFEGYAPAKRGKNKRNDLPTELQAVWDADRQKKAENKRLRALARAEAAADPLSHKKGGKKGRKAMLAAARLDPTITVLPNRVIDMTTLVQQIRRFIADIGGPSTMSLPPTDKETRKNIHEMAIAFNLKSQSKGKGDSRYTTLAKTTRSGLGVNEGKVAKIMRRGANGRGGAGFVRYESGDKGKARVAAMPRHRDGDEVGKAAPKIGESNIGFKMLASMGWTEGERIGVSTGGLHVPLTAVIKNTKLGLGATR